MSRMSWTRPIGFAAVVVLAVVCGCAAPGGRRDRVVDGAEVETVARADIVAALQRQVDAWNRGDVERFMQEYWRDSNLTFLSGGHATFGWKATLERYHRRYPDRQSMGSLTFSELHINVLAPTAAVVWGRWHLDRTDPVGGLFTLVFRKRGAAWVITHDHTSVGDS